MSEVVRKGFKMLEAPLYFEDIEVGYKFSTPGGRTFTNAEVVNFAQFTGDYNLVHIDREFAKTGMFGENVVHGACVLALSGGMFKRTEFATATANTLIDLVGFQHVKFLSPVKFNDTVHIDFEILDKTDDGEDTGSVVIAFLGVNQRDETVLDNVRIYKVAKKNYKLN